MTVNHPSDLPAPPAGQQGWPWTDPDRTLEPPGDPDELPRVTIVTPSYEQAEFLEEAIRSVLLQGYPNLEYIVLDGGSQDGSAEIIERYDDWITYWESEPDDGQTHALNKGFEKASGEILGWINSDDFLLPDALHHVAAAYHRVPDAGGWFGGCQRTDPNGTAEWTRWPNEVDADGLAHKRKNWVMQPACFFSRDAWETVGPMDEDLDLTMDFDLWLRIAKEFEIAKIDKELAAARIHEDAKTQARRSEMYPEVWLIQIRHGYEEEALEHMESMLSEYFTWKQRLRPVIKAKAYAERAAEIAAETVEEFVANRSR